MLPTLLHDGRLAQLGGMPGPADAVRCSSLHSLGGITFAAERDFGYTAELAAH